MAAGTAAAFTQTVSFIDQVLGNKTSGYTQLYDYERRSNVALYAGIFIAFSAVVVVLVFVLKKKK
jgi:hypothetical protein